MKLHRYPDFQLADLYQLFGRCMAIHADSEDAEVYRRVWMHEILPALGQRTKVTDVEPEDVRALFEKIGRRAPQGANQILDILSEAFRLAERWGMRARGSNPARGLEPFPSTARGRRLTAHEVERITFAVSEARVDGKISPPAAIALQLLILTGRSVKEILALEWEDVDLGYRVLRLRSKDGSVREVHLDRRTCKFLRRAHDARSSETWVVPGPLRRLDRPWAIVRDLAGLQDVRLDDLRRYVVQKKKGADPF